MNPEPARVLRLLLGLRDAYATDGLATAELWYCAVQHSLIKLQDQAAWDGDVDETEALWHLWLWTESRLSKALSPTIAMPKWLESWPSTLHRPIKPLDPLRIKTRAPRSGPPDA